jgi:hypothetical protein
MLNWLEFGNDQILTIKCFVLRGGLEMKELIQEELDWRLKLIALCRGGKRLERLISKIAMDFNEYHDPIFEQALLKLMRDLRPEIRNMAHDKLTNMCQENLSEATKKALEEYRAENLSDKKL